MAEVDAIARIRWTRNAPDAVYGGDRLSSWQVRREISTDLPDQVREVTGEGTAQGTVVLAGAPSDWSPWRGALARSGGRCRLSATVDDVESQQIVGDVREIRGGAGDGDLRLEVADDSLLLLGEVEVPPVAADMPRYRFKLGGGWFEVTAPRRALACGTWVLDHVLRQAGFYALPPEDPGCVVYASLQGSAWPNRGVLYQAIGSAGSDVSPEFEPTPAGEGLRDGFLWYDFGQSADGTEDVTLPFGVGDSLRICGTGGDTTGLTGIDGAEVLLTQSGTDRLVAGVRTRGGGVWAFVYRDEPPPQTATATPLLVLDEGDRFVATFTRTATDQVQVRVQLAGGEYEQTMAITAPSSAHHVRVNSRTRSGISGVMVTDARTESTYLTAPRSAILTPALPGLVYVPAGRGTAASFVRSIADAEQGAAWVDEDGVFRYANRDTVRAGLRTVGDLRTDTDLLSLPWREDSTSTYTAIEVPVTQPEIDRGSGGVGLHVWQLDRTLSLAPGETQTLVVNLDNPAAVSPYVWFDDYMVFAGRTQYYTSTNEDGTGGHPQIDVQVLQVDPTTVHVRIYNTHGAQVYLVGTDGEPRLDLWADQQILQADAPLVIRVGADGGRTLRLPDNPWRQTPAQALAYAAWLLGEVVTARPTVTEIDLVPDPARRILDRGRLVDDYELGLSLDAVILGYTRSMSVSGDSLQVTERALVRVYAPTLADLDAADLGSTLADLDAGLPSEVVTLDDLDRADLT